MKYILSIIIFVTAIYVCAFSTRNVGADFSGVSGLQMPVKFKLSLGDWSVSDSTRIDSIADATHAHIFRIDQFGNEVECDIVEGSVTVAGTARIGVIERGGKLSNLALFVLQNSSNRLVMIYTRFIYKSDTLTKSQYFKVLE